MIETIATHIITFALSLILQLLSSNKMKLLRQFTRLTKQRTNFVRTYGSENKCPYPYTMNDLPCPEGDWNTMNNQKQKMYNVHLVLGVGSLIGTIAFGFATNMFEVFNTIPDRPADIECYIP